MIIASRINQFAGAIFMHGKFCNMYMVHFLIYILNEWGVKLKDTNFLSRVLEHNKFFNKRISITSSFRIDCQLSKFTILYMPFKTKRTSLVNIRGLTDSALLIIIRIFAVALGAKTYLKLFGGGVFHHGLDWSYIVEFRDQTGASTKWPTFFRRHFQMHFVELQDLYLNSNLKIDWSWSSWQ